MKKPKIIPSRQNVYYLKLVLATCSVVLSVMLVTNRLADEFRYKMYMTSVRTGNRLAQLEIQMQLLSRDIDEDVQFTVMFDPNYNESSQHRHVPLNMPQYNPEQGPDSPTLKRVKGFSYDMFLFSAVVGNTSAARPWDTIVMQGWEHKSFENRTFGCCIKYNSGRLEIVHRVTKLHWSYRDRAQMVVKQYVCKSEYYVKGDVPELVTLSGTTSNTGCHKLYNWYMKTSLAYEKKDQIAVCAKLAYGNLQADDILTWFEIHRRMGMDKALLYTYNLNDDAAKVLHYYWSIGLADIVPFSLPRPSRSRKKVEVGVKNYQAWNDEQVPVFDCHQKLQGYKYLVVLDLDEYLIPTHTKSWQTLFQGLFKARPHAAGFTFKVQIHVTNWGVTNLASRFTVGQYQNRTRAITDRVKHMTQPSRVRPGGLSTHSFQPIWEKGYHKFICTEQDAVIHHFRSCRKDWKKYVNEDCYELERFHDTSVSDILLELEHDILELKHMILPDLENEVL